MMWRATTAPPLLPRLLLLPTRLLVEPHRQGHHGPPHVLDVCRRLGGRREELVGDEPVLVGIRKEVHGAGLHLGALLAARGQFVLARLALHVRALGEGRGAGLAPARRVGACGEINH